MVTVFLNANLTCLHSTYLVPFQFEQLECEKSNLYEIETLCSLHLMVDCVCVVQREVLSLQKSIQGSSFDTEYAIKYVVFTVQFTV